MSAALQGHTPTTESSNGGGATLRGLPHVEKKNNNAAVSMTPFLWDPNLCIKAMHLTRFSWFWCGVLSVWSPSPPFRKIETDAEDSHLIRLTQKIFDSTDTEDIYFIKLTQTEIYVITLSLRTLIRDEGSHTRCISNPQSRFFNDGDRTSCFNWNAVSKETE